MQFGIPEGSTTVLPVSKVDEKFNEEEKAMASLVSRPEWKRFKDQLLSRIEFHKSYLPGGTPIEQVPIEELGARWIAASIVIKELEGIISVYEQIATAVRQSESD